MGGGGVMDIIINYFKVWNYLLGSVWCQQDKGRICDRHNNLPTDTLLA